MSDEKEAIRQKIYGVPVNVNGFLGKIKYIATCFILYTMHFKVALN